VLWSGTLTVRGRFAALEPEALGVAPQDLLAERAVVTVGVSDPTGLREVPRVTWGGIGRSLEPGVAGGPFGSALGAPLDLGPVAAAGGGHDFILTLELAGSEGLSVLPVARETRVSLAAPWSSPSFAGAFLPLERRLGPDGFEARWKVLSLNRDAPQRWLEDGAAGAGVAGALRASAFGVKLLYPVDAYQRTTRSVKYAVLFALLTFLGFFAVEVGCGSQIHAVQYVVIGFALCLFYTLLLALSELVRFDLAYLIAAATIVALVTGYARGILRRAALAGWCGAVLTVVYGSLFVMLHLEELALLMGSLLLVLVCAGVMLLTRRLTWTDPSGP
ncbi:MAG TPA: cell envelope integrity protein CreD, partial [Desulfobacterales bacterium]|nr:cell envelope integrity protein CreD [Desulfobacterales bacterium]